MTNNNNTKFNALEAGMARGETLTSIEELDTEASPLQVDQHNIREYMAGVFAGLNMKLGREQNAFDSWLELGEDDLAREAERECERLYALVLAFAKQFMS